MTTDTPSATLDVPAAGAHESFRVSDPVEVRSLLKSLMDRSVTINLNGSDGSVYSTTGDQSVCETSCSSSSSMRVWMS